MTRLRPLSPSHLVNVSEGANFTLDARGDGAVLAVVDDDRGPFFLGVVNCPQLGVQGLRPLAGVAPGAVVDPREHGAGRLDPGDVAFAPRRRHLRLSLHPAAGPVRPERGPRLDPVRREDVGQARGDRHPAPGSPLLPLVLLLVVGPDGLLLLAALLVGRTGPAAG